MHIAARLVPCSPESASQNFGYHGCDIVVRELSPLGFEADSRHDLTSGTLVRLRLPGAGAMLARVDRCEGSKLLASFLNPVSHARLGMTVGMARATQAA
jgi:hypothetical protein